MGRQFFMGSSRVHILLCSGLCLRGCLYNILEQRAGFLLFSVIKIMSPSGAKNKQVCSSLEKLGAPSCDTNPLHVTPVALGNQEELIAT